MGGVTDPDPIRILVADDHALLREELRADLELEDEFTVVAEAADGNEALAAALRERPDVCLIDVHMPRADGIAAAAAIAVQLPETKILMLTASRDEDDQVAAVRAGAVGYMLKDAHGEGLAEAVRDVAAGGVRFSRQLLARLSAADLASAAPALSDFNA
jgi:DNA-binding NarL/FixJ family response regulator